MPQLVGQKGISIDPPTAAQIVPNRRKVAFIVSAAALPVNQIQHHLEANDFNCREVIIFAHRWVLGFSRKIEHVRQGVRLFVHGECPHCRRGTQLTLRARCAIRSQPDQEANHEPRRAGKRGEKGGAD